MSLLDGAEVQRLLADAAERSGRYLAGLDDRPVAPGRAAMRISVSGWATSDDDIKKSADAIIAAYRQAQPGLTGR